MNLLGVTIVCPFWGAASTYLFYRGWMAFLGIVSCLFGLARRRVGQKEIFSQLFQHLTHTAFCFTLLIAGFVLLFRELTFGRTVGQMLVYWVTATVVMAVLLPRLGKTIDRIWRDANDPDERDGQGR